MYKTEKEKIIDIVDMAFKTVTPWNKRYGSNATITPVAYYDGWNDCLKEIRKNRKKYLKKLKELV